MTDKTSHSPQDNKDRKAAVLAALQHIDGEWHLLYIKRATRTQDRHSGQVAFPGGHVEPSDSSAKETALREAEEEIGLQPSNVDILATLQDYPTLTNYVITPVVGVVQQPFTAVLQPAEVAKLFSIPLSWLAKAENRSKRTLIPTRPKVIFFEPWDDETLWGATAAMTVAVLDALEQGNIQLPY